MPLPVAVVVAIEVAACVVTVGLVLPVEITEPLRVKSSNLQDPDALAPLMV